MSSIQSPDLSKPLVSPDGAIIISKNTMKSRWAVLFLSCTILIANYYCYDNPSALHDQLKDRFKEQKDYELWFNLLYTVYSVPNVVLPFFGGYLVDTIGARKMIIVFAILLTLGQAVFALGCTTKSFTAMLIGRVIFGLGGESIVVTQSAMMAEWFKNAELALALGLNISVARLGSVINDNVSPWLASQFGVNFALWAGGILCGLSLVAVLMLVTLDARAEAEIRLQDPKYKAPEQDEKVSLGDVRYFRFGLWMLVASCLVVYGCILPFNNVASDVLMTRDYFPYGQHYGNYTYEPDSPQPPGISCDSDADAGKQFCKDRHAAQTRAGVIMGIPYTISACISPFLGYAVDRIGQRAMLAMLSPVVLVAVHLLLGFTKLSPIVPLLGLGFSFSICSAVLWPSVPYVVKEQHVGTAYGVITAVQNGGLALIPMLVAVVLKATRHLSPSNPYMYVELFFAGLAALGFFAGLGLQLDDMRNGNVLNSTRLGVTPVATDEEAGAKHNDGD
jgi:MFS family permease